MDLCLAAKQRPGPRLEMRWWEQEALDLEGIRKLNQAAERTEEGGGGGERDRQDGDCNEKISKVIRIL